MADPKTGGGLDEAVPAYPGGSLDGEADLGGKGDDPLAAEPIAGGASAGLAGLGGGGIAVEAASLGAGRVEIGSGAPGDEDDPRGAGGGTASPPRPGSSG